MFPTFDLEIHILKQDLAVELLRESFHGEDVGSAGIRRFQRQVHLLDGLCRFIYRSQFFKHLFTAFRTADGFFTVEGTEFLDHSLLMTDLPLLI